MATGQQLQFFIARNRLGQYCVPQESMHRPCAMTVMRGMVWEPATLAAIEKLYTGGDIVTAGAYFGDFLPFLSRLAAAREAGVLSFEPNPVNFACATVTCAINTLSNCRLIRGGLGASSARLSVKTHNDNGQPLGGGSRVMEQRAGSAQARFDETDIHTIDSHTGSATVGMIQLDIEGHEMAALEGAAATIARCRPLLVLEAHGPADFMQEPVMQRLAADYGYREIASHNQNLFFAAQE
jgi:FkbM family methyltransferase